MPIGAQPQKDHNAGAMPDMAIFREQRLAAERVVVGQAAQSVIRRGGMSGIRNRQADRSGLMQAVSGPFLREPVRLP